MQNNALSQRFSMALRGIYICRFGFLEANSLKHHLKCMFALKDVLSSETASNYRSVAYLLSLLQLFGRPVVELATLNCIIDLIQIHRDWLAPSDGRQPKICQPTGCPDVERRAT